MISDSLKNKIPLALKKQIISDIIPVSGGSINSAFRVETGKENYFLKTNKAKQFPGMFEAEAKGLQLLSNAFYPGIPEVIETSISGDEQFILMEFITPGSPDKKSNYNFGKTLARMHRNSENYFGLDHDNYIGSLPQSNKFHNNWIKFFINERITPLTKMAVNSGAMKKDLIKQFDKLFSRLEEIFPAEPPALLHGDLWSGNYMFGKSGKAWIFDPAVYYGHREMDIAMTKLFGGFSSDFYEGYNDEFPLEKDCSIRVDVFNLYPLLVHVNLFGGHYIYDVKRILERY